MGRLNSRICLTERNLTQIMKTAENVIIGDMCKQEGRKLKQVGSASGKEKLVRAG